MKNLFFILVTALFLISCQKGSGPIYPPVQTATLLSKITNVTPNSPFYGSTVATFTYRSDLLQSASIYWGGKLYITHTFSYGLSGLVGSTMRYADAAGNSDPGSIISSKITYKGDKISKITFHMNNRDSLENFIFYQGDKLISWENKYAKAAYTYTGDKLSQIANTTFGFTHNTTYLTFDNSKNITSIFPLWIYFAVDVTGLNSITLNEDWLPCLNNPLTITSLTGFNPTTTFPDTYTYEYKDGYPTKITRLLGYYNETIAHSYEYIQVRL